MSDGTQAGGMALAPPPGDEPRTWEQLRADAVAAIRAARARRTEHIVDIVLAVFDEEASNRKAAELLADCRLQAMDFRDGGSMEIIPARELAAIWVGCARAMLAGGPNYSETRIDYGLEDPPGFEMSTRLAGEAERYVFRVQRAGRLTPHEARQRAEQRAAAAEARATALVTQIHDLHAAIWVQVRERRQLPRPQRTETLSATRAAVSRLEGMIAAHQVLTRPGLDVAAQLGQAREYAEEQFCVDLASLDTEISVP